MKRLWFLLLSHLKKGMHLVGNTRAEVYLTIASVESLDSNLCVSLKVIVTECVCVRVHEPHIQTVVTLLNRIPNVARD